jgi:hypothetical protein
MKTLHLAPVRLALVTALFLMVGNSRIEAQTPASLAGDWRIVSFFVPKPLTLTKDGNNNVTDIVERNFFGYGLGRITFTSGGGVSGTFSENGQTPEALSGTFSITGQGQVTVNIPGDEDGPTVFHVNASQDFMVSAQRKGNSLDWVLLLREPSVVPGAEMVGEWAGFGFETPRTLALQKDGLGRITGVDGLNKFGLFPASLTVHAGGATFSGSLDGAFTGNVVSYSQGVLNLSITPAGENPFEIPFYINASRTIMVTVSVDEEFGGNELIVFMRKPTSMATTDVAGHWRTKMMQTPDVLTLVKNNGIVTEINGRHNFEVLSEKLTVGTDGYLTGEFAEGPTLGNFNLPIPANGGATVTLNFPGQSPDQVGIQLNATKDVAFNLEADTSSHEAVFIIRTPRVTSGKEETGLLSLKGSVIMHWASESGRALYESTDFSTWTMVPETAGQRSHTISNPTGVMFFRVQRPE